jgi:hypothetical protein
MANYANDFMGCIKEVLVKNEYTTETKIHAIVAMGDYCLAIEEYFEPYLEDSMNSLFSACSITLNPQVYDQGEIIISLRDSIIDAFISIQHGLTTLAQKGPNPRLQQYASQILDYIEALLTTEHQLELNNEFIKNVYELYCDITEQHGH